MRNPLLVGVRTIAFLECAKGAVVLLAGIGLLSLHQRDVQAIAEQIVRLRHLDPTNGYARTFLAASAGVTDTHLWIFAGVAFLYSLMRGVEGYGLWTARRWAEWFALISTSLYLPIEIYQLSHRLTWIRFGVFAVNIVIVAYMVWALRHRAGGSRAVANAKTAEAAVEN